MHLYLYQIFLFSHLTPSRSRAHTLFSYCLTLLLQHTHIITQHPYGESDQEKANEAAAIAHGGADPKRGWIGYLGPLPAVDKVEGAASASAAAGLVVSSLLAVSIALLSF